MISANNVTLRFGKKALFEDVNIKFTEGNCYGLIGANGAGKSTFLKILSGEIEPSKGDVTMNDGERLSVLQQDHYKYDEYQVLDTVIMGNKRLYEIMKEKDAIYMKEDFSDEDGVKAAELEAEFAEMNGCFHTPERTWSRHRVSLQPDEGSGWWTQGQGASCPGPFWQSGCTSSG